MPTFSDVFDPEQRRQRWEAYKASLFELQRKRRFLSQYSIKDFEGFKDPQIFLDDQGNLIHVFDAEDPGCQGGGGSDYCGGCDRCCLMQADYAGIRLFSLADLGLSASI